MFLTFVPLPPIILYLVYRCFIGTSNKSTFRTGLIIGCLLAVQYFICSEIALTTLFVALATLVALSVRALRQEAARRRVGIGLRLAGGAALVGVPLLAYPAWYAIAGPQHVGGPTQSVTAPGIDVLSTLLPVNRQLLAGVWPGWQTAPVSLLGNTAFLGILLIAVVGYTIACHWDLMIVRCAAVAGAAAWILALGPRLVIHNHVTSIPLPFAVVTHIPILQDIVPSRLTLYVDMMAAVLLAVGVSGVCHKKAVWSNCWGLVVAACGLALVMPTMGYSVVSLGEATYFARSNLGQNIPQSGVVLTYPYPVFPEDQGMLWQAVGGMKFSLLGGYVVRPLGRHGQTKAPPLLAPTAVPELLLDAWPEMQVQGSSRPHFSNARSQLPAFVRHYHISAIVVQMAGHDPLQVVSLVESVYGRPVEEGNFDIWATYPPRETTP